MPLYLKLKTKMNHKFLKLSFVVISILFGVVVVNAQDCPDTFSGTVFLPKNGITDTYYKLESVKYLDPSSEMVSTTASFHGVEKPGRGEYSVSKVSDTGGKLSVGFENSNQTVAAYALNGLIAGKTYKIEIKGNVTLRDKNATSNKHRYKLVLKWEDSGGWHNPEKVKEASDYQAVGDFSFSETFKPKGTSQSLSLISDYSGDCYIVNITSITIIGCVDKKIVSENGNKPCAGENNTLIAKGITGTCKWEISKDNKQTWEVIEGATESTITVQVTDECYYRCTSGSDVLTSEQIRPVVCCSVAGERKEILKVSFASQKMNATNVVNFGDLDDEMSKGISSNYDYNKFSGGGLKEGSYIVTHKPGNGGWDGWKNAAIKDHTKGGADTKNGMLIVNCGKDPLAMFDLYISDETFCKNTVYDFAAFIANIDSNVDSSHEPVNAGFRVYGYNDETGDETELLNTETGDLPYTGEWIEKGESFNSKDFTIFHLQIVNNHKSTSTKPEVIGNDIAIDDITFSTCSPEIKIYTDDKYKSKDTIVCKDDGTDVHLKLEAHAVYDLSTFFKIPYYLFQTSADKNTWTNVGTEAKTDAYIEIDVPKDEIYETGLWYRVWVGGDKNAVEKSAGDGKPGEGCGMLTAVSDPILIQYHCKCTPTDAPTVNNYSECPVTAEPYTKPLKDLVTSPYDKLRFYEISEGGTALDENATFDAKTVGKATYYVTNQKATAGKQEFCESQRTPINIEIKDAAVFEVTPKSIEKCFNDETPDTELTFTASKPEYDYTWTGTGISATGVSYTLEKKSASGTINVVASDPQGKVCESSQDVTYKITPAPEFTITSPSMVCVSNPEAEITVKFTSGSGHYVLTKNGTTLEEGDMSLGQTDVIIKDNVVATAKGTVSYKFSVKNSLGCENSKEFDIEVNDKVEIPLVPTSPVENNTICLGDVFDINATYTFGQGESLEWHVNGAQIPGETGLTLKDQAPVDNTIYTVRLIGGQCEGAGLLTITVDQPANPEISADKDVICVGTKINITDSDTETAKQYIWYSKTVAGTWNEMTSQKGKDITDFAPTETATYKKVAKNGACETESNEITVEVHPAIEFSVEPLDKQICSGTDVELRMIGYPEGSTLSWTEKSTGTQISTDAIVTVKPEETTTYVASVINVCEASKELTVTVLPDLNPEISEDVTICQGDKANLSVKGVGVTSIKWSPATGLSSTTAATVEARPSVTTKYTATVSNGVCEESAEVTVTVSPNPHIASVNVIEGKSCTELSVKVSGKDGTPPYMYSDDGKTYQHDDVFNSLTSGAHMMYIMDSNSCVGDTIFQIDPYPINPDKFFTPNDDDINDVWYVENLNCYEGYIVEIYDRFGRKLYVYKKGSFSGGSVTDDFPGWDGMYNGHQMPSDDYWYIITVEQIRKQFNGHFTLKR